MSGTGGEKPPLRRKWGDYWMRLGDRFRARGPWVRRAMVGLAFLVCVAALTREPSPDFLVGDDLNAQVANREIRAAFYFETPDLQRTQEARDQEMARVPEYFRVDAEAVNTQLAALRGRIALLREARTRMHGEVTAALRASTPEQSAWTVAGRVAAAAAARLKEQAEWGDMPAADLLALWLMPDRDSVPERVFSEPSADGSPAPVRVLSLNPDTEFPLTFSEADRLGSLALDALGQVLNAGVRGAEISDDERGRRVVVWRGGDAVSDRAAGADLEYGAVPSVSDAVEALGARLTDMAKRAATAQGGATQADYARLHDAAMALCRPLVVPTLAEDKVATATARARAAEAVQPVMKEVEAGEIIQDRGKRWTKQSRSDVQTYLSIIQREERPLLKVVNSFFSHAILVLLAFVALAKVAALVEGGAGGLKQRADASRAFSVALVLLSATLAVGRFSSYFEPTGFVLPVAAAAILCAILVNAPMAAFFSGIAALLVSAQYQYNWRLMLVAGAMALAGAFSISRVRRRSDMTAASLTATLVGLVAAVAVTLSAESLFAESFVRRLLLLLLNGGFCMVAVPGLLSPLERLFNLTTDITLLEYSDLNNPLLGELAVKAPATYAHSLMLGQIAEAAADAIGANGLLARVCAYYHDIGKTANISDFAENQSGFNIHDTLPPAVSAARIRSHVLQGAEIARRSHLPQAIVDGILEHHGTMRVGYFYQQAVEREGADRVNEADFRYPGPRPQRPETAILMICDASESGVRSLGSPGEEEVRNFVRKILDIRGQEGQFDDCNLTLKHLNTIADVVVRGIMSTMHTRVRYPSMSLAGEKEKTGAPLDAPAATGGSIR